MSNFRSKSARLARRPVKKEIWILIILAVIIIILVGLLIFTPGKKNSSQNLPVSTEGIQIVSPQPNQEVSSLIKITGIVNGNGWGGFEGQVGTVMLLANGSSPIGLANGVLAATTDWTKTPTEFEATLTFSGQYKGPAILSFRNENPSGDPAKDKYFVLPIVIK